MTAPPDSGPLRIEADSRTEFFDLAMRAEGEDELIVGRIDTGDFIALPTVGAAIIRHLQAERSIAQTEQAVLEQEGEQVDVADFVAELASLGFVRAVDGQENPDALPPKRPSFARLKPSHVRWLFSVPMQVLCGLLVIGAVVILVATPALRPRYQDMFFSSSTSVVLLGSTLMFLTIVAVHEMAHLVAARACGVPARISLGTRLYSLVAQTDMSGMWAVSRRERLRAYLAGMASDLILLGLLTLLIASNSAGAATERVASAAVILLLIGLANQFQLFMRTDLYFVLSELLRSRNLFEDATVYLVSRVQRVGQAVGGRKDSRTVSDPLEHLSAREARIVRAYAWFMLLGTAVALTAFCSLLLPALVVLFIEAARRISEGLATDQLRLVLDGGLTIAIEGGTQLLFLVVLVRSRGAWFRRLRNRTRPQDVTS